MVGLVSHKHATPKLLLISFLLEVAFYNSWHYNPQLAHLCSILSSPQAYRKEEKKWASTGCEEKDILLKGHLV